MDGPNLLFINHVAHSIEIFFDVGKSMKPTVKLSAFCSVFILLFLLFGWVMNGQLLNMADTVENLHDHPMAVMRSSLSAARDVVKISRNINEILLLEDRLARDREIGSLVVYENGVKRELDIVEARIKGEEGKALVATALNNIKKWQPIRDEILKLAIAGRLSQAEQLVRKVGDNSLSDVESSITKIANFALGEGMSYHAEGIDNLRKARVILIATGLVLVLVFLLIAVGIGQSLLNPQHAVRDYLVAATKDGLDLSILPVKKSCGEMGEPLENFRLTIENRIEPACNKAHALQEMVRGVVLERTSMMNLVTNLEKKSEMLNSQSGHLIEIIAPVIKTVASFSATTKQIEQDLNMMIQITSSQQLLISSIKNSPNIETLVQIEEQEKAINDYVRGTIGLVSQASFLSHDLVDSLKEISTISEGQICLSTIINELKLSLAEVTKHLDKVDRKVGAIAEILHCKKPASEEANKSTVLS
jgi:hypothetical protein